MLNKMLRQTSRHASLTQCYRALGTINVIEHTIMLSAFSPGILHRSYGSGLRRFSSASSSTNPNEQHSDLFRYTSGRWLWDEEQQLLDRYKVFDVEELQRIAARSVGANACLNIKKCGEGDCNKVFRLTMDNGMVAIARIPYPNVGPACYTTASEVATMDFVSDLVPSRCLR